MTNPTVGTTVAQPAAAEAVATKKVVRRGISNNTVGTTRLKFSHSDAKPNGLFLGHLDSVELGSMAIGEEKSGLPSFAGLEIPKLTLWFASNEDDISARKYVRLQFNAVESNSQTIQTGKEAWKVESVFNWLKHILNVYVLKGRPMTEAEEDALSLDFNDSDENGDYINVEPEVVIASWKKLFENFEAILNRGKDGKPFYKTNDGKFITVWLKLVRFIKQGKKGWQPVQNGDLVFPAFVGEGCIEIYKQNVLPSIKLDAIRETIKPMNIEKAKQPTQMPGAPAGMVGGFAGGVDVSGGFGTGMGSEMGIGTGFAGMGMDDDDLPM